MRPAMLGASWARVEIREIFSSLITAHARIPSLSSARHTYSICGVQQPRNYVMTTKDMDSLIDKAIKTLSSVQKDAKFPKAKIQQCSGIALLNEVEIGLGVTASGASGVLLAFKDETWSPPLAISSTSVGVGSLGFAEKETIMVLNQAAVDDIATSNGIPLKFSVDAGLTNYIGGQVGGGTGIGKSGLESCYAFSNRHVVMIPLL